MFLRIDSAKTESKITSIEFEDSKITFFFDNFLYLNFDNLSEREKFLLELKQNFFEKFSEGQSYFQIPASLIGEKYKISDRNYYQNSTRFGVKSYSFLRFKGHLEIVFVSDKEKLRIVLFSSIIDKIREKIE